MTQVVGLEKVLPVCLGIGFVYLFVVTRDEGSLDIVIGARRSQRLLSKFRAVRKLGADSIGKIDTG